MLKHYFAHFDQIHNVEAFFGLFRLNSYRFRVDYGRSGIMDLKIQQKKIDTHLRDESGLLSARNIEAFFFPFRSNLYCFRFDYG